MYLNACHFGVFAPVWFSVCLQPSGFRCVCTRLVRRCVCTRVVFGVFTYTFLVCVFAPGFVLQYTPIILRMPGSRKKVDFDYAVYDKSGKKALKDRDHKMATPDRRVQAIHITSDIEDLFDSYQIENLIEGDELNDYVTKLGEAKKSFRRIHARLKISEGDGFNENYPNYDNKLKDINKNFKLADGKLNDLIRASNEKKKEVEKLHKDLETKKLMQELAAMRNVSDEKRLQIKFEWEFCIEQIKWGLADSDWEKFTELEDIQGMILTLETQMGNSNGKDV